MSPFRRLLLWCLLMFGLLYLGARQQSDPIENDILAMLPSMQQDALTTQALERLQHQLGDKSYLALESPTREGAVQAGKTMLAQLTKASEAFVEVHSADTLDPQAWYRFYFPHRFGLLTEEQRRLLEASNLDPLLQASLSQLYSGFSLGHSALVEHDPLLLFPAFVQGLAGQQQLQSDQGILLSPTQGGWAALLILKGRGSVFSPAAQQQQLAAIDAAVTALPQGVTVLRAGALFHAAEATASAKREISLIGGLSLAGVVLLVLLAFRSLTPLLLAMLTLLGGLLSALVCTLVLFGKIYLLTLVFGTSLIGIAIDYSFHFHAERLGRKETAGTTLTRILPALTLALASSALAYLALALTPFPGMQQVGVFCAAGLSGAFITLWLCFPALGGRPLPEPKLLLAHQWLQLYHKLLASRAVWALPALMLSALLGLGLLQANDDIRQLQQGSEQLTQEESRVRQLLAGGTDNQFLLLRAGSQQQLLQVLESVQPTLDAAVKAGELQSHLNPAKYLPSIARQQQDYQLQQQIYAGGLELVADSLGLTTDVATALAGEYAAAKDAWILPEAFFASQLSGELRALWLQQGQQYAAMVLLGGIRDLPALKQRLAALPEVQLVDKVGDISALMAHLRQMTLALLAVALTLALLLFSRGHGWRLALLMVSVPALAAALTLGLLGWLGSPLTLFHSLALLLVFGIGVDYSLFFARCEQDGERVMLAVCMSAISTLLAFGLLALSQTPAIHYFGLTLALGIGFTFLLAPLLHVLKRN
ncbi:MMPL family transporter [Shewanella cyperi]|uniref:MMPL family transporter n=1 Tax=Shewanella cyperi TaxID=2814292 RepID=UPI001A953D77|nr:MMPL family transporter [Shewanella cyperi]QSX40659.1 MMPL family transporter [Shewanella cyperi]